MDIFSLYYYTNLPALTCNILFYSLMTLSNSITSSQNVLRFISDNKDCDSVIFNNEIIVLDIENKLRIINCLIFDVIKRFCISNEEYDQIQKDITNPIFTIGNETNDFELIDFNTHKIIIERINEPVRYALLSTSEIVQIIYNTIHTTNLKIIKYKQNYVKLFRLCLKHEIVHLTKQSALLDSRLNMLFELLKIYMPFQIPNQNVLTLTK
jgi:hypothetical protein